MADGLVQLENNTIRVFYSSHSQFETPAQNAIVQTNSFVLPSFLYCTGSNNCALFQGLLKPWKCRIKSCWTWLALEYSQALLQKMLFIVRCLYIILLDWWLEFWLPSDMVT